MGEEKVVSPSSVPISKTCRKLKNSALCCSTAARQQRSRRKRKKHFRLKKFESTKHVEKISKSKKNKQSRLRRKSPLVALKVESASGTLRQTRTPRVATMAKNSPAVGSSANSTKSPALSPFALPLPPKNSPEPKRKNGKAQGTFPFLFKQAA